MVSEKIGFKIVNYSGSSIGAFPPPIFTQRSVNFRHCFLRNLYLIRSLAGLSPMDYFSACLWTCFFHVHSLLWTRQTNFSKSFEISWKTWLCQEEDCVSSRMAYCFFSSVQAQGISFLHSSIHILFWILWASTNHHLTCTPSWIDSLLKTTAGFL